jgi:negative regulator of genetic competence, sporulation and motility
MALNIEGNDENMMEELRDNLENTGIVWVDVAAEEVPVASLFVTKKDKKYEVTIDTRSAGNIKVVQSQKLIFRNADQAKEEILLRIFGKGGPLEPEF